MTPTQQTLLRLVFYGDFLTTSKGNLWIMDTTFDCSNYIKIGHLLFYIDITIKGLDTHHLLNPNDGYDGLVALKYF
jgi:hypothetical protein